jgi:hypothetical protein
VLRNSSGSFATVGRDPPRFVAGVFAADAIF